MPADRSHSVSDEGSSRGGSTAPTTISSRRSSLRSAVSAASAASANSLFEQLSSAMSPAMPKKRIPKNVADCERRPSISVTTPADQDYAIAMFDEAMEHMNKNNIFPEGVRSVASFDDWRRIHGTFPVEVSKQYLNYFASTSRDALGNLSHVNVVIGLWHAFCAAWERISGKKLPNYILNDGIDWCNSIQGVIQLPNHSPQRAYMHREALQALSFEIWKEKYPLSLRERVSMTTFLALGIETGVKGGSILMPKASYIKQLQLQAQGQSILGHIDGQASRHLTIGSCYGNFVIHVIKRLPINGMLGPNLLVGYYTPTWAKERTGKPAISKDEANRRRKLKRSRRPKSHVIGHQAVLSQDALVLVLISLVLDGGLTVEQLDEVLHPRFVGDKTWVTFEVPEAYRSLPVFSQTDGKPISTPWMTRRLEKMSLELGFQRLTTAMRFRHAHAQPFKSHKVAVNDIPHLVNLLKEARGRGNDVAAIEECGYIQPEDQTIAQALEALKEWTLVDLSTPTNLNNEQIDNVRQATAARNAQLEAARQDPTATDEVVRDFEWIYHAASRQAFRAVLLQSREEYFKARPDDWKTTRVTDVDDPSKAYGKWDEWRLALTGLSSDASALLKLLQLAQRARNFDAPQVNPFYDLFDDSSDRRYECGYIWDSDPEADDDVETEGESETDEE